MRKIKCTSIDSCCVIDAINVRELVNPRNLYNYRHLPILCVRSVRSRPQTRRRGPSSVNKRARVQVHAYRAKSPGIEKRGDNRLCYARRIIEPNSRKRPLRDSAARRWHRGSQPRSRNRSAQKHVGGTIYLRWHATGGQQLQVIIFQRHGCVVHSYFSRDVSLIIAI